MRGKKGPIPPDSNDLKNGDPTAEEIVGKENVVDVGSPHEEPRQALAYKCSTGGCRFETNLLAELEEHCSGTGHGRSSETPADAADMSQQPELFSQKGTIHKTIQVPLPDEVVSEKRKRLSELYQKALDVREEKKAADADFNAKLKNLDEQMGECARVLRYAWTYENVKCEWRIIENENARGLYRLDTGELVEKQPLTAEDRAEELRQAEEQNVTQEAPVEAQAEVEAVAQ